MRRLILASVAAALAASTALANAPPPAIMPVANPVWGADQSGDDWTLTFGEDISIACPEAKKQLRITLAPAWEVGYGKPDGTVFDGPIDKVTVTLGDKTFEATQDPALKETVYVMPADADSVTAIMMATNVKVELTSDAQQVREGTADEAGTFDLFATTCAQINGLR